VSKGSKVLVNSLSHSSNTSNSSVNKDWENWALLQGKKEVAEEDVREIGRNLGVKFTSDKSNRFHLLTKEGRRELHAERGAVMREGDVQDSGDHGEGC
jgi:preprotein translocase subunit Sec63